MFRFNFRIPISKSHVLKTFHRNFEFLYFKMASKKSSSSANEAVHFVLADDDSASDFDSSGSEVSSGEFTDDDDDLNVRDQPLPKVAQRGSCRTRGSISLDALEYEHEEEVMPEWKKFMILN